MPETDAGLPAIWSDGLGRASIRSIQILAVVALAWTVIWTLTRVPLVLIPVTIALILASAISPMVRWLVGHSWPRGLAVLTSFIGILAVFGGVITGVVFLVRAQSKDLAAKATVGIDRLHELLKTGPVPVSDNQINTTRDAVQHFFTSSSFGTQVLTGARTAGEILAGLVLMAVILFFFLKDGEKLRNFLIGFLPPDKRATAHLAADRSSAVLGGYVRGTALVAASNGLIVGVALTVMGVPFALPLGVFVFIGGFIPIVGSTAAGTLAVAVALLSNGPVSALIVLAVIVGVNQLEHHLLQPVLMGRVLSIHGLAILLALAAGTFLAGVVGALLAVPITAVGWTVMKTVTGRGPEPMATAPGTTEA
ncbi:AI-2E family transporter [Arthrobacter liuii]|uniref:AI-2E family transporter n=1 Tax=Arthrobacter liuii TaxID=1476996 RepID=A0ABQ2B034_9MICC|nr:AI-2E family transporter [Arthrobacter liuii]GGI01371.1 AI-2E family transporter [Arthrobacter liuii]